MQETEIDSDSNDDARVRVGGGRAPGMNRLPLFLSSAAYFRIAKST